MGFLEAMSGLCGCPAPLTQRHLQKGRQLETVDMKVHIDCEGCESKIRKTLEAMDGVTGIEVAPRQNRVTVTGYVDATKVMRRVARKTGKRVEPWPYVPYAAVAHPYAAGTYDRKAPAGYVRDVTANYGGGGAASASRPFSRASSTETRYTGAFSDENANAACAIM
ncbi:heavy metal-associated isoprenylated plant protein 26-like [Lolium rigidum]|uniref:heavy metal-associated isoprenylated plant protein 26-like n=1 Tax=Lolium rigidum TaxID=89674 RepID=UPI001F5DD9C8|nr:heavy metal-associated isoprenylated plant protein 26-like [Lolium rigidum]